MLIPGIVSATFRELSATEIIQLCRQGNLQAVEWSENAHVQTDDVAGAKALRKQTEDAGLVVAAYGSYYRLGEQKAPEEVFRRSLVSAAALGAPVMRVWAGTIASADADIGYRDAIAAEAAKIAAMAQEQGVKVAFEWHKNTLTDTNASAMQLLKDANHPNLYCLWQPTVALDMQQRCEGIRLLGDRLLNFHVYYWDNGIRRPFAEGIQEWEAYLDSFTPHGTYYALLEFVMDNKPEQLLADAAALHALLEKRRG